MNRNLVRGSFSPFPVVGPKPCSSPLILTRHQVACASRPLRKLVGAYSNPNTQFFAVSGPFEKPSGSTTPASPLSPPEELIWMPTGLFSAGLQVGFRMAAAEPGAGALAPVGQAAMTDVLSALYCEALKGVIFLAIELDLALKDGATKL